MVFCTGDTHGDFSRLVKFCDENDTTKDDVMIILGDHGLNYYGERESARLKRLVSSLPITFVLIRGNHDRRTSPAYHTETYVEKPGLKGRFHTEFEFPSLLHAIDGECYEIGDKLGFVMGGAFSVDGAYRRAMYDAGYHDMLWFPDEQLTRLEFDECLNKFKELPKDRPVIVLAHTAPMSRFPIEAAMPGVDQSSVDHSMEFWFDEVFSEMKEDDRWLCGHFHIDKLDGNLRFMQNDVIELS